MSVVGALITPRFALMLIGIGVMLLLSTVLQHQFAAQCSCASSTRAASSLLPINDNMAALIALSRENDWPYQFDEHVALPGRVAELQAKLLMTCHGRLRELEDERKALIRRMVKLAALVPGGDVVVPTLATKNKTPKTKQLGEKQEEDDEEEETTTD